MTPEMEQKVLASLYDRLWDAITYSPGAGKSSAFDKQTSFVQFSKGEALRGEDFLNAAAPINPGGDLNAAETFSRMVDVVPLVQGDYAPSATRLSQAYASIVQGANSNVKTNPDQQKIYHQAYSYLNTTTKIKEFDGGETTQTGPSRIFNTYLANRDAYANALSGYRLAYGGYDLNDPKQQREWQARAPALQAALDRTWNLWRGEGATQVERALAALDTTINSAVRNVLELPNTTLAVAEACSGIRSLVSLITLSVVLAYFTERRVWIRSAIVAASIPIAVVANAARVAGTGLASHWFGRAAAEGFFHGFSGWLMFAVAFAGLLAVQRVLRSVPALRLSGWRRMDVEEKCSPAR